MKFAFEFSHLNNEEHGVLMNEELIKKYLLGELSQVEAETLEERLVNDQNLFDRSEIVEAELIDDYLQNRLSISERQSFEKNYAVTEARRRKVKSAESFFELLQNESFEPISVANNKTNSFGFFDYFLHSRKVLAGVLGGIVIGVILLGIVLYQDHSEEFAGKQDEKPTPELTNENKLAQNIPVDDFNLTNNSNTKKTNEPNKTPKSKSSPEMTPTPQIDQPVKPVFAAFTLLPGTLRAGGEQTIKIPASANKIVLRLAPPQESVKYQTYRASVKTVDGETVFASSNLNSLSLNIPAAKFRNQTYIVFLEGITASKTTASVAEYTFRAVR